MYTEVDRPLSLFGSTYSIQSMKATALDSKRKRSRNSGPCLNPSNNDAPDLECARLWVEKYKPQLVDDLVMAPKKVAEIRQWLLSFSSSSNGPKLLILTGGPGIGKSTTVVLLAKELGLQILQWTHNNNMTSAGKTRVLDDRIGVVEEDRIHRSSNGILHQTSKGSTYTPRRPMEEQYQGTTLNLGLGNFETFQNYEDLHSNQLSSLDSFLQSASLGYTSVILEPDMESTWIQSKQLVNSRTSDHYKKNKQDKTKNPKENIKNSSVDDIISDGDDDGIHARPTKQRGPGVSSFSSVPTHMLHLSKNRQGPSYSSIILLEELPTLNTEEREEQFRQLMSNHICSTQVPMILIFSDVYEGKYRPEDLERILDRNVLYSSAVKIMEINPVTKPSMKKCLNHIIQAEYPTHGNPRNLSRRGKGNTCKNTILDSTWIDEIHTCTGGDLRQAIMTLQFLYCAKQYEKKKSNDLKPLDHHHRDVTLSTFHALGKLLYAKRRDPSSNHLSMSDEKDHHRPPLDFNPEQVLEGSSIGLYGALTFLGYHSPDFFTDIMELSDAMDTFSDAAFFMDKVYTGLGDPMSAYASSFASRAVACANKHAAPNKFRQFTSPKYFTVVRKREWNRVKMSQMLRRLSNSQGHLQVDVNISSSNQFFMECFSLVHSILPLETQGMMEQIQSQEKMDMMNHDELEYAAAIRHQDEILQLDDIVDSDDDQKIHGT